MIIKEICKEYGLTQKELAEKLHIPLRTIESWAQEKRKPPNWTIELILFRLKYDKLSQQQEELKMLREENKIKMYEIITEYTNGMTEQEAEQLIRNIATKEEWELEKKYIENINNGEIYDGIEYMIEEIPTLAEKIIKLAENEEE